MKKSSKKIIALCLCALLTAGTVGATVFAGANNESGTSSEPEKIISVIKDNDDKNVKDETVYVIANADGSVSKSADVGPPKEMEMGDEPMTRVSIFMSVFSVHVNRAPMAGKIVKMHYRPGAFVDVSLDKESENNERQELALETASGKKIIFVQIAGLVARRILTFVKEGDSVKAGERFGLIRFGSRLDVYLPKGTAVRVIEGQTAVAGETVLADINVTGESAQGEIF